MDWRVLLVRILMVFNIGWRNSRSWLCDLAGCTILSVEHRYLGQAITRNGFVVCGCLSSGYNKGTVD